MVHDARYITRATEPPEFEDCPYFERAGL